ncbi:hypothetical protein ABPG72_007950 [Tetrahymena utriculariae]
MYDQLELTLDPQINFYDDLYTKISIQVRKTKKFLNIIHIQEQMYEKQLLLKAQTNVDLLAVRSIAYKYSNVCNQLLNRKINLNLIGEILIQEIMYDFKIKQTQYFMFKNDLLQTYFKSAQKQCQLCKQTIKARQKYGLLFEASSYQKKKYDQ